MDEDVTVYVIKSIRKHATFDYKCSIQLVEEEVIDGSCQLEEDIHKIQ